jgi:hypothetical protein
MIMTRSLAGIERKRERFTEVFSFLFLFTHRQRKRDKPKYKTVSDGKQGEEIK